MTSPHLPLLQAARSYSLTPSSVSTMPEFDDFNETLNQVLAWLLQAETRLKQRETVSDLSDNQVKEQFRDHEVRKTNRLSVADTCWYSGLSLYNT